MDIKQTEQRSEGETNDIEHFCGYLLGLCSP